jgi:hypothetical protein
MFTQRIFFLLMGIILLTGCHKSGGTCTACAGLCTHSQGNIAGNWKLEASIGFSAPGNSNTGWVNANPAKPVTIAFANDSLFSFNENYSWNMYGLDRYKMIDSSDYRIYSTNPSFGLPVTVKILNSKEIQIHYMGVDRSTDEKYFCY